MVTAVQLPKELKRHESHIRELHPSLLSMPCPDTIIGQTPDSAKFFCENYIEIDDRNRKRIKFKYNPAQEILHKEITGRDITIKASQLGITTFFLARYFKDTITIPGTTSVVIAHEEFLTQRLINRVSIMYRNLPQEVMTCVGPVSLPKIGSDSKHEKTFPEINSTFYLGTARAHVFGRGEPIHRFLASEVAFWPDTDRILTPSLQRVPLEGHMIIESTPNGEGNRFYDLVQEAIEGTGRFNLVMLHWWLEPEYRIPKNLPRDAMALPDRYRGEITDYTAEELEIIKEAGWEDVEADERIRWRRVKIEEIKHMFWQEFFEDITSCFITNAQPYYDMIEVDRMRKSAYPAPKTKQFEGGNAKIWEEPDDRDENPNYIIAVDPGQGIITHSVALVFRVKLDEGRISYKHCATLAGLLDPQSFAPMVMALGDYYKTAMIASERNGHGLAFCAEVSEYPNLYRQHDVVNGQRSQVVGWKTTGMPRLGSTGTKTFMMSALNHNLQFLECHDIDVIRQIASVRIGAERRLEFAGRGDDYHDAAAIFAAVSPTAAPPSKYGKIFDRYD